MKVKTLSVLAGLGSALILSNTALAALDVNVDQDGVAVELHSTVMIGGEAYDVYRVYAYFTSPTDAVFSFGAGSSADPMIIQNHLLGQEDHEPPAGSGFYNTPVVGSNFAPTSELFGFFPDLQWDSYFTVGAWTQEDAPGNYAPSGVGLPAGTNLTGNDYSMVGQILGLDLDTGLLPQTSFAGWNNETYGGGFKVGLMQLTVKSGEHVRGWIGLVWTSGEGEPNVLETGLYFNSVPAPGALALLGLAGLVGSRRRRA